MTNNQRHDTLSAYWSLKIQRDKFKAIMDTMAQDHDDYSAMVLAYGSMNKALEQMQNIEIVKEVT